MTPPSLHTPARRTRRRDGWTPARIRTFLQALRDGASVSAAAAAAGMSRQGAYAFRRSAGGAEFARAWDMARAIARERRIERNMGPVIDRALRRFRRLVGPRFAVHVSLADARSGHLESPLPPENSAPPGVPSAGRRS